MHGLKPTNFSLILTKQIARIWNFILSHIETDCVIGTLKKLFAKPFLNSKEDLLSTSIWLKVVIPPY